MFKFLRGIFSFSGILGKVRDNIKEVLLALVLAGLVWLLVSNSRNRSERDRLNHNVEELVGRYNDHQRTLLDLKLSESEMSEYLKVFAPSVLKKIDSANIRIGNIQKVVVQKTVYVDTTARRTDLDTILTTIQKGISVRESEPVAVPFVDQSPCLIIRGEVIFDGNTLHLDITERKFESINEFVADLHRGKLFGFLPIRLGKRELRVTAFNDCGTSETKIFTKAKGRWRERK